MDFATYVSQLDAPGARSAGPENRIVVARTDSTNRLARRVVSELVGDAITPPGAVVLALEQTAGRGRHGRRWESPAGAGVYASRLLPVADTTALQTVPLLAAVGLARVLGRVLDPVPDAPLDQALARGEGERVRLKWPNDLVVRGRKIGGVLVESVTLGGDGGAVAIVGFGVNYREGEADGALAALGATSVLSELRAPGAAGATGRTGAGGSVPSLGALALLLLAGLDEAFEHLGETAYAIRRFRELTLHRAGDPIRCRTGDCVVEGELVGFEERGFLLLRGSDGVERSISSGEIVEEVEA